MRYPLWHRPYLNYVWIQALIQRYPWYSVHVSVPEDYVDRLLRDWAQQRPDLDFSPVGIVTRLERVRSHLEAGLKQVFDRYDLSAADFVVIVSLRRAGAPYRLPQTQLMARLGLTSGTISVRVDRLAGRGVVVREDDPDDRRVQLVRLTDEGLRLFDDIAPVHLANEDRLLSALTPAEQEQLAGLLRRLLTSFEDSKVNAAGPLGVELYPAHIARSRRHAVGLSDPPGMLVAAPPLPGTPAADAGLRQGDLITSINDREIRSCIGLAEVLSCAAPGAPLRVSILRGEQPRQLQLTPPALSA
jgi:DNA-binding MarR family transcriptional regulator